MRNETILGVSAPKPRRSVYDNVCACGRQKQISTMLSDDDCIRFACEVCDAGWL